MLRNYIEELLRKSGIKYNSTPPTLADGDVVQLQADSSGNLKVREQYMPGAEDNTNNVIATSNLPLATTTYTWSRFVNLGANATLNVKATAGNVFSIYCYNTNAAARFIQIHNTATTPSGGAAPVLSYLIPATGAVFIDSSSLGEGGTAFSTGIAFAFSTTATTYTAGTAGEQLTIIHYK